MAAADPLAPLDAPAPSPAAAEAVAAAPKNHEATAAEASRPRGGCLKIVLLLLLLLIVLGGAAGGGIWWFTHGSGGTTAAAGATSATAAEPSAPPPALEFASASVSEGDTSQGPDFAKRAERIPALISAYETELLAAVGTAPSELIVAASGRQTADSANEVPRHERWEIQFPPGNTMESYTRQLEYFKIEVGLIGGSDQVEYLVNIADPVPTVRKAPVSAEKRLYLIWQRGSMREADEQLCSRARVPTAGKIVAHFCPEQMESDLAQIEDALARTSGGKRIRKTIFGIKANDFGGFHFFVIDQKTDG